ncbi:MAG: hypothetical protein ACLQME_00065 [Alphaproteobacteria bacterium]
MTAQILAFANRAAVTAGSVTRLLTPEVIVLVLLAVVSLVYAIMLPEQIAEIALRF